MPGREDSRGRVRATHAILWYRLAKLPKAVKVNIQQ